jgi:GT2 family glycosyltransferase
MKIARGKYICVMDADDISEPDRLKKQFQFMENNPDIGICGSFIKNIPANSTPRFITDSDQLKVAFLSNNYCSHPSLIMKKEFLDKYNLRYNEDFIYSADFDLCARALRFLKVQNIPDVLLQYRRHPGQISSAKYKEQQRYADVIRINQLIDNLDLTLKEIPVLLHLKLMKRQHLLFRYKPKAEQWVMRILEKNDTIGYYDQKKLKEFLFYCISASLKLSNQKKSVTH